MLVKSIADMTGHGTMPIPANHCTRSIAEPAKAYFTNANRHELERSGATNRIAGRIHIWNFLLGTPITAVNHTAGTLKGRGNSERTLQFRRKELAACVFWVSTYSPSTLRLLATVVSRSS
jgi:hypothetical protein